MAIVCPQGKRSSGLTILARVSRQARFIARLPSASAPSTVRRLANSIHHQWRSPEKRRTAGGRGAACGERKEVSCERSLCAGKSGFPGPAAHTWRTASAARAQSSRVTSRCVTQRIDSAPSQAPMRTPSALMPLLDLPGSQSGAGDLKEEDVRRHGVVDQTRCRGSRPAPGPATWRWRGPRPAARRCGAGRRYPPPR